MCFYHTSYNPLERSYWRHGFYHVTLMSEGAWVYIMDDFGNAVPVNEQTEI